MNQFVGAGHRWSILTRLTPSTGGTPALLGAEYRLPRVPKTRLRAESGGAFWVGEGNYNVEWLLLDETGRVCRKQWKIEAKLHPSERGITPSIAPGTVAEVSFRRWSVQEHTTDLPTLQRLTVLLVLGSRDSAGRGSKVTRRRHRFLPCRRHAVSQRDDGGFCDSLGAGDRIRSSTASS